MELVIKENNYSTWYVSPIRTTHNRTEAAKFKNEEEAKEALIIARSNLDWDIQRESSRQWSIEPFETKDKNENASNLTNVLRNMTQDNWKIEPDSELGYIMRKPNGQIQHWGSSNFSRMNFLIRLTARTYSYPKSQTVN